MAKILFSFVCFTEIPTSSNSLYSSRREFRFQVFVTAKVLLNCHVIINFVRIAKLKLYKMQYITMLNLLSQRKVVFQSNAHISIFARNCSTKNIFSSVTPWLWINHKTVLSLVLLRIMLSKHSWIFESYYVGFSTISTAILSFKRRLIFSRHQCHLKNTESCTWELNKLSPRQ